MADGRPGRPAKYTKGHEDNAVDYYLQSGKTQAGCAADLGIPKRTLGKWVRARKPAEPERAKVEETREPHEEVERLRIKNEFLKKQPPSSPRAKPRREDATGEREEGELPRPDGVPAAGRAATRLLRLAGARRPSATPGPRCEPRRDGRGYPRARPGRPHDTVTALGALRRHDAARGAQVHAWAGHAGRAPARARAYDRRRPEGAARARPDAPRPPKPSPHHQAGRRRLPPEDRTGMALHGRGGRPVHAHGAGPGLPRAHDGRPADRRARAVPGARLRRARRDLSLGPRQPARTRGRRWPTGRTAHGARRTT